MKQTRKHTVLIGALAPVAAIASSVVGASSAHALKGKSMSIKPKRTGVARVFLSMALAVPLAVGLELTGVMPSAVAQAATQASALDWARSKIGTYYDQDGAYGSQCVDLIRGYYVFFGKNAVAGNAKDYATNAVPAGFTRYTIANAPGGLKAGDVFVYTGGTYGHVGIVESVTNNSNFVSIDANWGTKSNGAGYNVNPVKRVTHTNYSLWGVIRPSFTSTPVAAAVRTAKVMTGSNLRTGPGTTYAIGGSAAAGSMIGLVCYKYGGGGTGYYGYSTLWYRTDRSSLWIIDSNVYTGTSLPVTPAC